MKPKMQTRNPNTPTLDNRIATPKEDEQVKIALKQQLKHDAQELLDYVTIEMTVGSQMDSTRKKIKDLTEICKQEDKQIRELKIKIDNELHPPKSKNAEKNEFITFEEEEEFIEEEDGDNEEEEEQRISKPHKITKRKKGKGTFNHPIPMEEEDIEGQGKTIDDVEYISQLEEELKNLYKEQADLMRQKK